MNAAGIAASLGERAEAVCRRYLPRGRKQGRYWVAGNLDGTKGRSLFVRPSGPGVPGKWTDAATSEHGDLLDLIHHRSDAPTLRAALAEARAFLALPASPSTGEADTYDACAAARRLWRRCRAIGGTHAEAYLHARGLVHCSFPALRFHPELFYSDAAGMRRLPALVAAVTGDDGSITGVQRTWVELIRQPDLLKDGSWFYKIHLFDDYRGPIRAHDRERIREVAEQRIRTCELM